MKKRVLFAVQLILAGALGVLAVLALLTFSPYPQRPRAVAEGKTIHAWLSAYADDHEGRLPDNLESLAAARGGAPAGYDFSPVLEYRGAGKNLRDLPPGYTLLRCRAGEGDAREVRITAEGRAVTKSVEAWAVEAGQP